MYQEPNEKNKFVLNTNCLRSEGTLSSSRRFTVFGSENWRVPHVEPIEVEEQTASFQESAYDLFSIAATVQSKVVTRLGQPSNQRNLGKLADSLASAAFGAHKVITDEQSEASRTTIKTAKKSVDFSKERKWLAQNREKHRGKWVALSGSKLIASDEDMGFVGNRAKSLGIQCPYIVFIPIEEVPSGGI